MDWIYALQVVFLGVVEGLTEFLPVSSTGHLIIAGDLIGFHETAAADTFYVAIQAGAIVAVCWHYKERILSILMNLFKPGKEQRLAVNTVVAFIPAAVLGVLLASYVKHYLFNPAAVATALVVGGILILWLENWQQKTGRTPRVATMDDMTWKDALGVGFMQCLALIPGTSRLRLVEESRDAFCGRAPRDCRGVRGELRERHRSGSLAPALRGTQRLQGFRLVPHRLRHHGVGAVQHGIGGFLNDIR